MVREFNVQDSDKILLLKKLLNETGKDGWELVSVGPRRQPRTSHSSFTSNPLPPLPSELILYRHHKGSVLPGKTDARITNRTVSKSSCGHARSQDAAKPVPLVPGIGFADLCSFPMWRGTLFRQFPARWRLSLRPHRQPSPTDSTNHRRFDKTEVASAFWDVLEPDVSRRADNKPRCSVRIADRTIQRK